jgi:hypothetical protein
MNLSMLATTIRRAHYGLVIVQYAERDFVLPTRTRECVATAGGHVYTLKVDPGGRALRCLNVMLYLDGVGLVFEKLVGSFNPAQALDTHITGTVTTRPTGRFQMCLTWDGKKGWGNGFWSYGA